MATKKPTCYLCGSAKLSVTRKKLRNDIRRDVLKCGNCGLVFLRPKKENLQAYYAKDYRKQYSPTVGKHDSSQDIFDQYYPVMQSRLERVKPYLGKNKRILDIGCSAGHFLATIKPYVKECVGLEFNLANAEFVREKLGIPVYTDPIEKTDLPENHFDVIFCLQTLEHIEDPLTFLKTIKRYLKKGGVVYIEVPNLLEASLSVFDNKGYEDFYYRAPHLFYYNPATLKRLMSKAGYKGKVLPFQWYNVLNQFHWIATGEPQGSGFPGLKDPELVPKGEGIPSLRKDFNTWIQKVDVEFKKLWEKHSVSDQIVFVGRT